MGNGDYLLTDPYIVHDDHRIWRYGSQHSTFQTLHTHCNSLCPGQKGATAQNEDTQSLKELPELLDWFPTSLAHTKAMPASSLQGHFDNEAGNGETCGRCLPGMELPQR